MKKRSLLEEVFSNTLGRKTGAELFLSILAFFAEFLNELITGDLDMVVLTARKEWCLFNVMEPFLYNRRVCDWLHSREEFDRVKHRITHDGMMAVLLNELSDTESGGKERCDIRVGVVDETCIGAKKISACARKLHKHLGIRYENIYAFAFAVEDNENNVKNLFVTDEPDGVIKFALRGTAGAYVKWGDNKPPAETGKFVSPKTISCLTDKFIRAFHLCSVPYVSFNCGFLYDLEQARKIIGSLSGCDNAFLKQEDLKEPFSDSGRFGFHNVTCSAMYENDVEAFVLFPKETDKSGVYWPDWLSQDKDIADYVRFYVNRKLGKLLVVPDVPVRTIYCDAAIVEAYPDNLRVHFREYDDAQEHNYEGKTAAHKLLSYASGYVWGKKFAETFLRDNAGDCPLEYELISMSGLSENCAAGREYSKWLDSESVEEDLTEIWAVVNANKPEGDNHEIDSKKDFEKDFNRFFDVEPVSYYGAAAALFRGRLDKNSVKDKKGILVRNFVDKIQKQFPVEKYPKTTIRKISATMLFLRDSGQVSLYVDSFESMGGTMILGNALSAGEQSCHAYCEIEPNYAFFLQRLVDTAEIDNEAFRQINWEKLKDEIRTYFNNRGKMPIDTEKLLIPLDEIREDWQQTGVFFAFPYIRRLNASARFFIDLTEEHGLKYS